MDAQSRPDNTEPTLFSAIITPHRSLSAAGFMVVMALVGVVSFAGGLFFFILGAWPVVGFLGLDVLLIYWAFRANYRSAAAFEQVTVTPSELRLRRSHGLQQHQENHRKLQGRARSRRRRRHDRDAVLQQALARRPVPPRHRGR